VVVSPIAMNLIATSGGAPMSRAQAPSHTISGAVSIAALASYDFICLLALSSRSVIVELP
jgi:hypothetical protein